LRGAFVVRFFAALRGAFVVRFFGFFFVVAMGEFPILL